ncbi:MAG TPA: hypothetical protein VFD36_29345 [Kofleriaceae bacterium]|nr:hypothetical protein [Kofleriaceae bacterium]
MTDEADSDGSGERADPDTDEARDDAKYKSLTDDFSDVELGQMAFGPDGTPSVGIGPGASVPQADPRLFICLRGPCVHYWQRETFFASGNPKATWDDLVDPETGEKVRMPRQVDRTCTAHPGTETELTDELVYDCTKWVPMTPRQVRKRERARRRYYKNYPDHDPAFVPIERVKGSSHGTRRGQS